MKILIDNGAYINNLDDELCSPLMNCALNTDHLSSNQTFFELLKYNPDVLLLDDGSLPLI